MYMDLTEKLPICVGFIMDGNRRWATEQGLPTLDGHLAGKDTFFSTIRTVAELQIPHAVFYAFSTENWQRSETEVTYLLNLFTEALKSIEAVRLRIIGRRSDFSHELQIAMTELEEKSNQYTQTTIWIALSYGGRAEILSAVNQAVLLGNSVSEETFNQLLYTAEMPDPDLIIRTGGEFRLSNFLPWQSVYSELFFTDTYWPAFTKAEFTRILAQYGDRQRRRGK